MIRLNVSFMVPNFPGSNSHIISRKNKSKAVNHSAKPKEEEEEEEEEALFRLIVNQTEFRLLPNQSENGE